MLPDQAAELLQWEERGKELTEACVLDPKKLKAVEMVMSGFPAKDVASTLGFDFDEAIVEEVEEDESLIRVWVCKTARCRNKERVATATEAPDCPICRTRMEFLMSVGSAEEIGHMRRIMMPDPGLRDPLARTDKTKAPDHALGDL